MSIYDRISKALRKRWSRYGCGPEHFTLNVHHWHELYRWLTGHSYVPDSWWTGRMRFMGTMLIMRDT